jgi:glutathione S-transferase
MLGNYLCPYTRRALYAAALKNVPFEFEEIDLTNKPPILLEINPAGAVPAVIMTRGGMDYRFFDSMVVVDAIDAMVSGVNDLYPRTVDGEIDPILQSQMRNRLLLVDKLVSSCYPLYRAHEPTDEQINAAKDAFTKIDALLARNTLLASDITGNTNISAIDIALLPHAENMFAVKD